jgi:diguanylate cyclase
MGLFRKKNRPPNKINFAAGLQACEEKRDFFLSVVRELLLIIKDVSIDIEALNAKGFRKRVDALYEKFQAEKKTKKVRAFFEKQKKYILAYIEHQTRYLNEKEAEFKDMIDILTRTVAEINIDNKGFNEKIYKQSERIEQISDLKDLKKIKNILKQEVELVRRSIREKQLNDKNQIDRLAEKITTIYAELIAAEKGSFRDDLTGLYNKKAFERYLRESVERKTAAKVSFALLALDIDNFEAFTQTYGREMANRAILAIAQECQKMTSSNEFLARCQETLFLIVFPGKSLKNSLKKATQLCKTIAVSRYSVDDVNPGHVLTFTVSIGLSVYSKGETGDRVTQRAFKALDKARRSGGNKVVSKKGLFLLPTRKKTDGPEPF